MWGLIHPLSFHTHALPPPTSAVTACQIRAGRLPLSPPTSFAVPCTNTCTHTSQVYRGGYSASERRQVELELFSGRLLGVAATNALELGVDIGALDVTLHLGFQVWTLAGCGHRRPRRHTAPWLPGVDIGWVWTLAGCGYWLGVDIGGLDVTLHLGFQVGGWLMMLLYVLRLGFHVGCFMDCEIASTSDAWRSKSCKADRTVRVTSKRCTRTFMGWDPIEGSGFHIHTCMPTHCQHRARLHR